MEREDRTGQAGGEEARARLLVIEDDPPSAHLLTTVLRHEGYAVTVAPGGEAGLAAFSRERPELVLLDVMMPGMDGFEVCARLRAQPEGRHTPVLFLTALDDRDVQERALEAGADDLLVKPLQRAVMLLRVRSLLRMARLRAETERGYKLIRAQQNALVRAQQQKDELVRLVVHDLKNPLSSILANARYLQAGDTTDVPEVARDIHTAAESMHRLVVNLLDIGCAEDGLLLPRRAPVDVPHLLSEVAAAFRRRAEERRQHLLVTVHAPLAPVEVDPELLRRMLQNLLDNGLEYSPPGGTVRLEARTEDGALELCVTDEGPGIPPDMRERIFDKHVRLQPAAGAGGHGFGLAYCRLAAEAHGGRIWVEDHRPRGSAFRLRLPSAADPPDRP